MADMCPHAQDLVCDIFYRCDECYSQGEKAYGVLFKKIRCSCEPAVCEANPELSDLSNQRISALLRQLVEYGELEKVMKSGTAYFRLVD